MHGLGHTYTFSAWNSHKIFNFCNTHKYRENVLESSWNVSETLPWLLASAGHQQPWYWLCRIGRPLSYLRKYLNYLCHINVKEWHKMLIRVYVPSERVNRLLVSGDGVWLNILGEIGEIHSYWRFLCRQVISGYRVIILNDTKCEYTFNFAKINSACKAGKFVQIGSIIMCTCIYNGIMAYQYFSSKLMGWNKKNYEKHFIFFSFFFKLIHLSIVISYHPLKHIHLSNGIPPSEICCLSTHSPVTKPNIGLS